MHPQVVTARKAREMGLTRVVLARDFDRLARGVYVPAGGTVEDPDTRLAVAAALMPPDAVLGGWCAARLHERAARGTRDGITVFDGVLPEIDALRRVALPALVCGDRTVRMVAPRGVRLFRSDVPPEERTVVAGVPVTSPARTAFDLARLWPRAAAVVALDRLWGLGLLDAEELLDVLQQRRGWTGVARARRALAVADPGAESPRESHLRLVWLEAGLPRPLANPEIRGPEGRFVARVDLLDPYVGLVGEYDGEVHSGATRRAHDAARQQELEGLGLVVVRANEPDLATAGGRRAWQARLLLGRARAVGIQASSARQWVAVPRTT